RACHHRQGRGPVVRSGRAGLIPAPPAARRPPLLVPPSNRDSPLGLDAGPESRRDDDRLEQGQNEGPAQPRSPRPPGVTPGGRPARRPTSVRAVSSTVRDLRTRSASVPTRPYAAAAATGPRRART